MEGHQGLALLAQVVAQTRALPDEVDAMRGALAAVGADLTELARYRATFGDELEKVERERIDAQQEAEDLARNNGAPAKAPA